MSHHTWSELDKVMDILFLFPPANKQINWEYHLGIAYIQAFLKKEGYQSLQLIPQKKDLESIVDEILSYNCSLVGMSCYDTNFYYISLIAERLKAKNEKIRVIVGGPSASFSYDYIFLKCQYIDICVIGEGEYTTKELIEKYEENSFETIKGIAYRDHDQILVNKKREHIQNIDLFPSPLLQGIDVELANRVVIQTARGCPYQCIYCNAPVIYSGSLRYHSIDRVIDEVRVIREKFGENKLIYFGDDAFTLNIERTKKILRRIDEEKLNGNFFCETRVEKIDNQMILLMKKVGFSKIDFGLESADLRILKTIRKVKGTKRGYKKERRFLRKMKKQISLFKKNGIETMINIIIGLPGESKRTINKTMKFIKKTNVDCYSHNYLRIYKGTPLYEMCKEDDYFYSPFYLPIIYRNKYDCINTSQLPNSISKYSITEKFHLYKALNCPNPISFKLLFINNDKNLIPNIDFLVNKLILNELLVICTSLENIDYLCLFSFIAKSRLPTRKILLIIEMEKCIEYISFEDQFFRYRLKRETSMVYDPRKLKLIEYNSDKSREDYNTNEAPENIVLNYSYWLQFLKNEENIFVDKDFVYHLQEKITSSIETIGRYFDITSQKTIMMEEMITNLFTVNPKLKKEYSQANFTSINLIEYNEKTIFMQIREMHLNVLDIKLINEVIKYRNYHYIEV